MSRIFHAPIIAPIDWPEGPKLGNVRVPPPSSRPCSGGLMPDSFVESHGQEQGIELVNEHLFWQHANDLIYNLTILE